jgi:hypothetical protein
MMTPQRPDDIRRISLKTLKVENSVKSKNTYFINVFQPKDGLVGDGNSNISVKRIKGENCIGVEITSKNHTETFLFSNKNKIVYGNIQSESKWISIVKDSEGKIVKKTNYDKI